MAFCKANTHDAKYDELKKAVKGFLFALVFQLEVSEKSFRIRPFLVFLYTGRGRTGTFVGCPDARQ